MLYVLHIESKALNVRSEKAEEKFAKTWLYLKFMSFIQCWLSTISVYYGAKFPVVHVKMLHVYKMWYVTASCGVSVPVPCFFKMLYQSADFINIFSCFHAG